jgi:hypothetical protein
MHFSHFSFYHVKNIAIKSLWIGVLTSWIHTGHAIEDTTPTDKTLHNLPDLPGADEAAPGHFLLDEQSAEFGYDSRFRKWGAKLDEYSYLNPSFTLDYGMLLTSKFGAGASLTRHIGYSEVLVNGVYAPKRNLRIRLANGQLRTSNDYVSASGGPSNAILQNSYLVDVRRKAGNGRMLPDFGLTAYSVRANGSDPTAEYAENRSDLSALTDDGMLDAVDVDSSSLAAGRLDGYMLNLGLQPTPHSRLELRRERTHLRYHFGDGNGGDEYRDVNHIRYSQYFSNCARLQGRYSSTENFNRLDLKLAKNRWSVNLSQALDSDSRDTAIQVAYAIPLGRSRGGSRDCGSRLATARAFEPLVDATVAWPDQLPRAPLAESIPE